jgi:hypothetical protein
MLLLKLKVLFMCLSSFLKYISLAVIIGSLIILSIFSENLFYLAPVMVFSIMWSKIACSKCKTPLLKDKNGWYMFTMRPTCRTCGENTLSC